MRPLSPHRDRERTLRGDDRGVSTALGYVLSLAITSLLISGLMFAAGGYVEDQREQVIREELEVIGQTLIADIEGADRLSSAVGDDATLAYAEVSSVHPRRVGSSPYTVELETPLMGSGITVITLTAATVDVTIELKLFTNVAVEPGTLDGGPFVVVYDGSTLEVREA